MQETKTPDEVMDAAKWWAEIDPHLGEFKLADVAILCAEVERLRAALVEKQLSLLYCQQAIAQRSGFVYEGKRPFRDNARAELVDEGLLPPDH